MQWISPESIICADKSEIKIEGRKTKDLLDENSFRVFLKMPLKNPKGKFAYVSSENGFIGKEDFPLKIERSIRQMGNIVFTVMGKSKKSSDVSIIPDKAVGFSSELSDKGLTIKFSCLAEKNTEFQNRD